MSTDEKIEVYLAGLRTHLRSATASEEEETVNAVGTRIQELAAKPGMNVESAIDELGPAAKVAGRYRDALLIAKASKSTSPILLLHASLRNGVMGVLVFLLGLAGYWLGGCIVVFGTLALLWSAAHYKPDANAAIGSSMLQTLMTVIAGAAIIVLTTLLLRVLLRISKRTKLLS